MNLVKAYSQAELGDLPAARVETKTIWLPSGEKAARSSNAGLSVRRSRPVPLG